MHVTCLYLAIKGSATNVKNYGEGVRLEKNDKAMLTLTNY